ncbi:MAG: hypothetical protein ABJA16_09155 [Nakamurella sp.]
MNKTAIVVGAVMVVLGLVFMFQGLGYLGGSVMTGKTLWAVLGPIIAVVGAVVLVIGIRRPGRAPRA